MTTTSTPATDETTAPADEIDAQALTVLAELRTLVDDAITRCQHEHEAPADEYRAHVLAEVIRTQTRTPATLPAHVWPASV